MLPDGKTEDQCFRNDLHFETCFQLVSIRHGAVIITLQTVSHLAVQRVSCVMMLSEATMVISKGHATNLGRGGVCTTLFACFRFSFMLDFLHCLLLICFFRSLSISLFVSSISS
jgi:hypothetical protein